MKKIDVRELCVILIALLIACVVLSSCSTRKKVVTEDNTEISHTTKKTFEKDSSVIEYMIDTTKIDAMEVVFTKIDYYKPDSMTNDPAFRPAVKSVTTGTMRRNKQNVGKTTSNATHIEQRQDSLTHDTATIIHQNTTRTTKKAFQWWWLLLLIPIMYYLYKRVK